MIRRARCGSAKPAPPRRHPPRRTTEPRRPRGPMTQRAHIRTCAR
jgi:hypothetical protein